VRAWANRTWTGPPRVRRLGPDGVIPNAYAVSSWRSERKRVGKVFQGVLQVRAEGVVDRLLTHAAEALIRTPSRRPNWLRPSFPMKLILTMKRELLIDFIRNDPSFRHYLYHQANKRGLGLDPRLIHGVTAENFERRLNQSTDPHRLVATAFVGPDDELCEVAAPWVQYQELIPAPQIAAAVEPVTEPAPEPTPPSSIEAAHEDVVAAGRDVLATDEVDEDTPSFEELGAPEPIAEIVAPAPPPMVFVAPAEPHPDMPAPQSAIVAALEAEVASLRRRNAKLEAENKDLLSRVPTKIDRRRMNKQSGTLKRTQEELERAREQLVELGDERDHLIEMRATAEEQLDEAIDARAVAEQKSRTLEAQLATTEGRARYLRKAIDNDVAEARSLVEGLEQGRDRTKATRRIEALTALSDSLDAAFPPTPAPALPRSRRVRTPQSLDLAVTPLGGGEEIGGSAILVEGGGHRILVDAGLHPDGRGPVDIGRLFEDGGPLDAIIVTHAHTDHAGYIPALVDRYQRVPVICSEPTAQLLPTMWADSARVMDRRSNEATAADGSVLPPLYGTAEVEQAEARIQELPFDRTFRLGDFEVTLFVAGHILGAAGVVIAAGDRKVVITGDISGPDDTYLSVEQLRVPSRLVAGADLLVIETTYCHDDHSPRTQQESGLVSAVRSVVSHRGRVLIPAFGLGRSQEIVMILREHLPDVPVLLDGMAKEISTIYEKVAEQRGEELTIIGGRVNPVENRSRMIETFHSGVIVSTSGMLTGGPSVEWAKAILPNEADALLLCGYQDEEAPGRRLQALAGRGSHKLLLADRWGEELVDVRAKVDTYRLSAHADRRGLLEVIKMVRPKATMLVHGERDSQRRFRLLLRDAQLPTVATARWLSG
jgi:Cft2 family RNA processing exonuclease